MDQPTSRQAAARVVGLLADYLEFYRTQPFGRVEISERTSGLLDGLFAPTAEDLTAIRAELGDCQRCALAEGRTNLVFGEGSATADLVLVGEGPGFEEDVQGRPFVGRAGELLTKIIAAMTLDRSRVYIANIVKCRPPGNRDPRPDEIATCLPFLMRQLMAIVPRAVITLGNVPTRTLLRTETGITRLRGHWHRLALPDGRTVDVMPTFHPAFLLRNAAKKKEVWHDVQLVMDRIGLKS
ncbi:MAG: uracil-DNA glycosylase [Proteobacteria bacterium]|nr:uracil-DNA glycosylase [Pseudomonadota bacterium]MBU1740876.1 uracil-DNA glycosylase [Pseudomonadota bacterium]